MTTVVVTVVLLLANAFFVGAEFAAMSARRSQLEPLAEAGSSGAQVALHALRRTGLLLATAQLGITVCSVLLGAVSEAALHHALEPVAEHLGLSSVVADVVALAAALTIVVFLHVVYGEMIPKNISIAQPERAAVLLVPPLVYVSRVVAPVIHGMDWVSKAAVRLLGVEPKDEVSAAFTAEEVAHILDESRDEGLVGDQDYERLGAALEFSDKDAADVAVSLDALVTVTPAATPLEIERLVAKHGFSRYPVRDGGGELSGYLHLKDVLYADDEERHEPVPGKRVRRLATVQPGDEVEAVLQTMQASGSHVARVVAEDGTVTGVVFLEDVIEELVGEVSDASQR
ncbi:HlyC/CorC family transporter [Phycicoccus endophyticus]|uniref:HlyC/CorC family transporter n=1 Tax=Phycicoccus endophyticus TaxID=1690220 RepID=A0A7G9QYP3_9MICO|nr:hemolysin family protein [Phycicoccus endophyticus]NHI20496.1 HlyC/CorC family transporter [Phycicoccus endophyticus]QNN48468.1 HlyC/CorC family transporter [Phycicoccus endophyticus]GGL30268.1 membrane protein [Phycicoccus endophyticus]